MQIKIKTPIELVTCEALAHKGEANSEGHATDVYVGSTDNIRVTTRPHAHPFQLGNYCTHSKEVQITLYGKYTRTIEDFDGEPLVVYTTEDGHRAVLIYCKALEGWCPLPIVS